MPFDDSGSRTDEGAAAGSAVAPGPKRVFVTSLEFYAELTAYGGAETGRDSADAICQNLAEQAGLSGRYLAWISDSQVDAIDRIQGDGPFVRVDGEVAFPDRASLADVPQVPINVTETGEALDCTYRKAVWTGTSTGGTWNLLSCVDWTSRDNDFEGQRGDACAIETWTDVLDANGCNYDEHLCCFEQ
jgi:hypothetical protein